MRHFFVSLLFQATCFSTKTLWNNTVCPLTHWYMPTLFRLFFFVWWFFFFLFYRVSAASSNHSLLMCKSGIWSSALPSIWFNFLLFQLLWLQTVPIRAVVIFSGSRVGVMPNTICHNQQRGVRKYKPMFLFLPPTWLKTWAVGNH